MKPYTTLFAALILVTSSSLAVAAPQGEGPRTRDHRRHPPAPQQPAPPPPPQQPAPHHPGHDHGTPPAWNARGWTLLGTQTVQGRRDRDVIKVGRYEGRFDQLTLRVEDNDVELLGMVVHFERGKSFAPKVGHYFRQGSRTRIIDLPGENRLIKKIDLRYRKLGPGGRARVEVWGRDTRDRRGPGVEPPTTGRPRGPGWDSRGWTLLGDRIVNGRTDRDIIEVGRSQGKFRQLTLRVEDSDVELLDMRIHFRKGKSRDVKVGHYFREGSRSRVIDLPGNKQVIQKIELRYRNLPGGGRATVQVWGR